MPAHTEHSRYAFDETDPTQWRDLNAAENDPDAEFEVEGVAERTLVYRQLIPPGRHPFGAEFKLFDVNREQNEMDSSWTSSGDLPRREVGIIHKIGIGVAAAVLDHRTDNEDIEKVLSNAYLSVKVNDRPFVRGSLETLPVGFGVYGGPPTNGFPAADAVPDRFPVAYTNEKMRFDGTIRFPPRPWLQKALEDYAATMAKPEEADTDEDGNTERDCDNSSANGDRVTCVTLRSPVLVTFYMTGIFGRISTES